jgi:hypothetical protein
MSKKNKNKRKFESKSDGAESLVESAKSDDAATKPSEEKIQDDVKREFKKLAVTVVFILAILIGLYYYDQQTHILQTFTHKLFGLF